MLYHWLLYYGLHMDAINSPKFHPNLCFWPWLCLKSKFFIIDTKIHKNCLICNSLSNKSLNLFDFIFCGSHYFITKGDKVFILYVNYEPLCTIHSEEVCGTLVLHKKKCTSTIKNIHIAVSFVYPFWQHIVIRWKLCTPMTTVYSN